MWDARENRELRCEERNGLIAVAVDRDKSKAIYSLSGLLVMLLAGPNPYC